MTTLRQRAPCSQESRTAQLKPSQGGSRAHWAPLTGSIRAGVPIPTHPQTHFSENPHTLALRRVPYVQEAKTQSQTRMYLGEPRTSPTPHTPRQVAAQRAEGVQT